MHRLISHIWTELRRGSTSQLPTSQPGLLTSSWERGPMALSSMHDGRKHTGPAQPCAAVGLWEMSLLLEPLPPPPLQHGWGGPEALPRRYSLSLRCWVFQSLPRGRKLAKGEVKTKWLPGPDPPARQDLGAFFFSFLSMYTHIHTHNLGSATSSVERGSRSGLLHRASRKGRSEGG